MIFFFQGYNLDRILFLLVHSFIKFKFQRTHMWSLGRLWLTIKTFFGPLIKWYGDHWRLISLVIFNIMIFSSLVLPSHPSLRYKSFHPLPGMVRRLCLAVGAKVQLTVNYVFWKLSHRYEGSFQFFLNFWLHKQFNWKTFDCWINGWQVTMLRNWFLICRFGRCRNWPNGCAVSESVWQSR